VFFVNGSQYELIHREYQPEGRLVRIDQYRELQPPTGDNLIATTTIDYHEPPLKRLPMWFFYQAVPFVVCSQTGGGRWGVFDQPLYDEGPAGATGGRLHPVRR